MELPDSKTVLIDDEGKEIEFDFLDDVEYRDNEYVYLTPADDEDGEVIILKVVGEEGDDVTLVPVDDEALLEDLFHIFRETNQDLYEFE